MQISAQCFCLLSNKAALLFFFWGSSLCLWDFLGVDFDSIEADGGSSECKKRSEYCRIALNVFRISFLPISE